MQTIRRLYVYLVSFISLEVVVWGLIGLLRSMVGGDQIGSGASQLASALSLIAVGVPVFLLHWWLVQRGASKDIVERSATFRAVFLHGVLAVTLVPVVQNTLTLANRLLLVVFELDPWLVITGGEQSLSDNLIAIVVDALVAL